MDMAFNEVISGCSWETTAISNLLAGLMNVHMSLWQPRGQVDGILADIRMTVPMHAEHMKISSSMVDEVGRASCWARRIVHQGWCGDGA